MMSPPRIAINGRFLTQRASGVQRFAMETITAIDALLGSEYAALQGRVELLAPKKARDYPLKNIPLRRVGFSSGYVWEQFEFPAHAGGRTSTPGRSRRYRARIAGEFLRALSGGLRLPAAAPVPAV
jgi:hypothetical protein